jgi:hypothetical protein
MHHCHPDREQAYAQAQVTMDRLIWSTQPKATPEQRRELVAILPDWCANSTRVWTPLSGTANRAPTFTRQAHHHPHPGHPVAHAATPAPDTGSAALEESVKK